MASLNNKKQNGFTLLEVLITVILFSFGILGVAGMQMKTQKFNRSALFETQAVVIAHDMFERMRANVAGQREGFYHLQTPTKHLACYKVQGCTSLQMAQTDMFEWNGTGTTNIATKLPGGQAVVCLDSTPHDGTASSPNCDNSGLDYAVKIWWTDSTNTTRRSVSTAAFQ